MPSIQQILNYVDRKYGNQETDTNKVSDLNDIHKRIYVEINKLKNNFEIYETTSIATQMSYTLPSNCNIDNIIEVKVSKDTTITSSTQWDNYEFASLNDDVTTGCYYGEVQKQIIALLKNGLPLDTSGYSIRIFYYKRPNALTSDNLSVIPELDEDYHDLLKYQLITELASQGQNPDTEIADYYQSKFDEYMKKVKNNLTLRYNKKPAIEYRIEERWV